jgi:hypothetical protein
MKHLLMVLIVTFHTIVFSAAHAWSPLESIEAAVEKMQYCYVTVASSEQDQEGEKKAGEEEEEPECD